MLIPLFLNLICQFLPQFLNFSFLANFSNSATYSHKICTGFPFRVIFNLRSSSIPSNPSFHCSSSSVSFLSILPSAFFNSQMWTSVFSPILHNVHFVSRKSSFPFLYLVLYSCILRRSEIFQFCSSLTGFFGRFLFLSLFLLFSSSFGSPYLIISDTPTSPTSSRPFSFLFPILSGFHLIFLGLPPLGIFWPSFFRHSHYLI